MKLEIDHNALAIALGALLTICLVGKAAALHDVKISGKHGVEEIENKCVAAGGTGGTFFLGANGSYGCTANGNTVTCTSKGKCTGTVQDKTTSLSIGLSGVLKSPTAAKPAGMSSPKTEPIRPGDNQSAVGARTELSRGSAAPTMTPSSGLMRPALLEGGGGGGGAAGTAVKHKQTTPSGGATTR